MKNVFYGSMSAFFVILACCVISYTYRESKMNLKMKVQSTHEICVKVNSIDEAVDYLMQCDSILDARERQWWERKRNR